MPGNGFFACYLLTPVAAPQRLRCTYVGFTVSPTRRIRQHNGELVNGAKRTKKYRPWEMIVVVHGFPSKFHALQFEYAWQHPYNCRFTKERLRPLLGSKGLGHPRSVKRKLIELHEMLHVAPWLSFPLSVSYTDLTIQNLVRTTSFFQWPAHMSCDVRSLHEFAKCQGTTPAEGGDENDETEDGTKRTTATTATTRVCYICDEQLTTSSLQILSCYHPDCRVPCHSLCLADHFLLEASMASDGGGGDDGSSTNEPATLRPEKGTCPDCTRELLWPLLVQRAKAVATGLATQPTRSTKKRRRDSTKHKNAGGSSTGNPSNAKRRNGVSPKATTPTVVTAAVTNDKEDEEEEDDDDDGGEVDWDASGWFDDDGDDHYEYVDVDCDRDTGESDTESVRHVNTTSLEYTRSDDVGSSVVDLTMLDD